MRFAKFTPLAVLLVVVTAAAMGCSKQGDQVPSGFGGAPALTNLPNGSTLPVITGANVIPVTVNGGLCSASTTTAYPNKPCVSVTICAPGSTTNCQTINDILLDTGSFGLRVFSSLVTVPLTQVESGSNPLAECAQFGTGSDWGPVKMANVILGGEPAVQVPIQVIDSTFAQYPSTCGTPDLSPSSAGFNGILGVGLFAADCGTTCNTAGAETYYSCAGTTCTDVGVTNANQVTNPVTALPTDNNGVIVEMPAAPSFGMASASGYLVLGIGTETNNKPSGVNAYTADSFGEFNTTWDGGQDSSFVDSGSNAYFFPSPSSGALPDCAGGNAGWYCPSVTVLLSATDQAASGSQQTNVQFLVGNTNTLLSTGNNVFMELGGDNGPTGDFDWGLPFYLGRNIYVGFEGATSVLGTGPYWAF